MYKYIKNEYKKENNNVFSKEDIQMNKQLEQCPVITGEEYERCYFLVHKAYSYFFGNINKDNSNSFTIFNNILDFLYKYLYPYPNKNKERTELFDIFRELRDCDDYSSFVENSIRFYTGESCFCYSINKVMRNFDPGLIKLGYYMGPLLFGLNKYVSDNPKLAFSKDMELYRTIQCTDIDFYLYKLNIGHIICFPSLTSTSSKPIEFKPSELANEINNINENDNDIIKVKMIFKYKHENGNISPGIIIENNKGKDGEYLSSFPEENEVILFPFTFAKIVKIESNIENGNKIKIIYLEIVNREYFLEYNLKFNGDALGLV